MPKFTGVVRVLKSSVRLDTARGPLELDPFPPQAPLGTKAKADTAKNLFGYLQGQSVTVAGKRVEGTVYNAHLAADLSSVEDQRLAPGASDRLTNEIEQYFQKDSTIIAAKLNDVGIHTVSALYHWKKSGRRALAGARDSFDACEERVP